MNILEALRIIIIIIIKRRKMMKLTVAMLFCDKDCHLAEKMSYRLASNLASIADKEIIFLDNREANTDELKFDNSVTVYSEGKNLYQLEGRKYLINKAKGDYIWFVDADDTTYYVDRELVDNIGDYDTIIFSYIYGDYPFGRWKREWLKPLESISEVYGAMAWNKWFKTSLLKKVEEYVPDNLNIVASEDLILNVGASIFGNGAEYYPCTLYKFNVENSQSGCTHIDDINVLKHIMLGHKEANDIMLKMCEGSTFTLSDIWIKDANFFLYKVSQCSNDIIREAFNYVVNEFDLDTLKKAWEITQLWAEPIDAMKVFYLLDNKWPDEFNFWFKEAIDNNDGTIEVTAESGVTTKYCYNDIVASIK